MSVGNVHFRSVSESSLNNTSCQKRIETVKLAWTLDQLAQSLHVSVPFLRLELKRGRLRAARLGRRVVVLDTEVSRYLDRASDGDGARR